MPSEPKNGAPLKRGILASRVLRVAANFNGPSAAILMYHSVVPDPRRQEEFLGNLGHDEKTFRAQMELLSRDYHPIGLEDAISHLRTDRVLPRRSVVVTFDDGYADNYEFAMPVLNRLGIPATFYVTVKCVEQQELPWPCRLRYAFRKTKAETWTAMQGKKWELKDAAARERAFVAACEFCAKSGVPARNDFLTLVERELEACLPAESGSLMMTREQVQAIARHGHAIGSHTMTHPNLAYLDRDEAKWEFSESWRRLESMIDSPVKHFAYPCPALSPHWDENTLVQSREAGYESALTTDSGLLRRGADPLRLPRIRPTKTAEGLRWTLECAFAGRGAR